MNKRLAWEVKNQEYITFLKLYGRIPQPTADDSHEASLAMWYNYNRHKATKGKAVPQFGETVEIHNKVKEMTELRYFRRFEEFVKKNNRLPQQYADGIEKTNWLWYNSARNRCRKGEASPKFQRRFKKYMEWKK
jgi:hypothetical protein